MNKLRYAQKFILICALLTTPLLLLLLLLVSDIDTRNLVIQRELDGTHFLSALRLLREHVPEMQSQEHMYASGIVPTLEQLTKTQSQLEDDLKLLQAVDHSFGVELNTTTQIEALTRTY